MDSNPDLTQPETVEWAKVLLKQARYEEYLEFLEEAVERFPEDPEVRIHYATALTSVRPDEVGQQAVMAIQLEPDNPWRLVRAASLLFNVEEFDAARNYVGHASRIAPPGFEFAPELSNLAGRLMAQSGNDDIAEEGLSIALAEEPGRPRFACDLARFFADRGRTTEALATLDEALKHNPHDPKLMQLRGDLNLDG